MGKRPLGGYRGATPSSWSASSRTGEWDVDQQFRLNKDSQWPSPPPGPYLIDRSLRFNSADSAYLNRTPASAGNRKTWTWAGWVKRTVIGETHALFGNYADGSNFAAVRISNDYIQFVNTGSGGTNPNVTTPNLLRDPSAWYHIVVALDTTQATASNRCRAYINGVELTTSGTYPDQNADLRVNTASLQQNLGALTNTGGTGFDGYLADIHFIDGQALDPTSFGEFSATTGVWMPKQYTGTYGTNGFHLDFADNSTAAALGTDSAGSNDWTVNNIAVGDGLVYSLYVAGTTTTGYPKANMFDGSTATTGAVTNAGGFTWTPPGGISYSSGVEVFVNASIGAGTQGYIVNGGTQQNINADGSWQSIATGSGTLTTLVINNAGLGNNNLWLSGIRINGTTILTDGAGSGNDSLVDVPVNGSQTDTGLGGEVRGNYCTLNPLTSGSYNTLSNGNLDLVGNTNVNNGNTRGNFAFTTGKWYVEMTVTTVNNNYPSLGLIKTSDATTPDNGGTNQVGYPSGSIAYEGDGNKRIANSVSSYGSVFQSGDVIGVAIDADNGAVYFSRNGTWQNSGVPTSGSSKTGAAFTWTGGSTEYIFATAQFNGSASSYNFGQRSWAYQAPSGFKALNTANLPAPVITKPSDVMDVKLYTGNGSTQTISGLGFEPDFVWLKGRSVAYSHQLYDQVRGAGKLLGSNNTNAESTVTDNLTAFTSTGFSLGSDAGTNQSSATYAAWCWDAGSSTVTNTQGSISSQVRANASAGFSVVTYSGNSSAGSTFGHGLGVAPQMVFIKIRNGSDNWSCYHASLGNNKLIQLNNTNAAFTSSDFNNTSPTSSVFSLGGGFGNNSSGYNYVAYCFAPVAGYSSFGSYTGNGSADGPFVYTGFRPRWILFKVSSTTNEWRIYDAARLGYNTVATILTPNDSQAEGTTGSPVDLLSNGFKVRGTDGSVNSSGATYIYAAFAESPFQYARAR